MTFTALLDRQCTVTHRAQTGAEDRYNVPTWVETTTENVIYARQQRGQSEDLDQRQTQEATFELFFEIGVDIDGSDLVTDEVDGLILEVTGPPKRLAYGIVGQHIEVAARTLEEQP